MLRALWRMQQVGEPALQGSGTSGALCPQRAQQEAIVARGGSAGVQHAHRDAAPGRAPRGSCRSSPACCCGAAATAAGPAPARCAARSRSRWRRGWWRAAAGPRPQTPWPRAASGAGCPALRASRARVRPMPSSLRHHAFCPACREPVRACKDAIQPQPRALRAAPFVQQASELPKRLFHALGISTHTSHVPDPQQPPWQSKAVLSSSIATAPDRDSCLSCRPCSPP